MKRNPKLESFWNKIPMLLLSVVLFFLFSANSCESIEGNKIKSAAYWTSPVMNLEQAKSLAQHQVLIVDMENIINNKHVLKALKSMNPDIKLLAYSNPIEFYDPAILNRPIQRKWLSEAQGYPDWFLRTGNNDPAVYWSNMVMMNISALCPKYEINVFGRKVLMTYSDWMADKLLKEVLSDPIWDGYFMDNSGGNISWVYQGKAYQLDINGDGLSDPAYLIDNVWSQGIRNFLSKIREKRGKEFIMVGNKGSVEFMDLLDGKMFEAWPNDYLGSTQNRGWNQCMENALAMEALGAKYIFFQASNASRLEFTLASALLLDNVYVILGQDNISIPPVFRAKVGKPSGPFVKADYVYYRDFENGSVEVRPEDNWAKITIFSNQPLTDQ